MSATVSLRDHFRKLATFEGREDRGSFWPYAALAFVIVNVAGSLMLVPEIARSMRVGREFDVRNVDPGPLANSYGLEEFSSSPQVSAPELMPAPGYLAACLAVTLGLAVLLYAAAVVRRLHDRGKSGAWGLMPLPFLAWTSVQMVRLFGATTLGEQPDSSLFLLIAVSNILCGATLLALVVLLAGAGDPGPNRYELKD